MDYASIVQQMRAEPSYRMAIASFRAFLACLVLLMVTVIIGVLAAFPTLVQGLMAASALTTLLCWLGMLPGVHRISSLVAREGNRAGGMTMEGQSLLFRAAAEDFLGRSRDT